MLKQVKIKCIISGKSIAPYVVPKKINIYNIENKTNIIIEIESNSDSLLKFIDVSFIRIKGIIANILNIQYDFTYEIIETVNIERIFISKQDDKDLIPIAFYIGDGLQVNTLYELIGYETSNPINQTLTFVFTEAIKCKTDLEKFTLKNNEYNELSKFNINKNTVEDVYKYLEQLYTSYAYNITKIYNRFDLHLAIDLVFKSVLSFNFDNSYINKGWGDMIVIGDTSCGKGEVARKLLNFFNVGEFITADNCSYAGLIAGVQQLDKNWTITWGKIPMNNKGLVVIDEASELKHEDWTKLTSIRSDGEAIVTKIKTQVVDAKTRLIFIANPINKLIRNYSYGIQAINELVKSPEDIRRFDYVLIIANNEVLMNDINKHYNQDIKLLYTKELEQKLITWIWSRSANEIVFSPEAIKCIYNLSNIIAKMYTPEIPLVQGENIRIKLAKIAVSFAGRLFSNKKKGEILYVDSLHVECAYYFLNLIYKKNTSGYFALSKVKNNLDDILPDEVIKIITRYFNAFRNQKDLMQCLMQNNNITIVDISEHMNQQKEISREIISKLLKYNCIIKKYTYYVKTPAFINWLKQQI